MNDDTKTNPPDKNQVIKVSKSDLPVHCPTEAMGLWNSHPRVFIPLEESPEASCPYCGTRFELSDD